MQGIDVRKGGIVVPPRRRSLPRVADRLLVRPRLEQRLNRWAPVTVVRGLPGYGKTTLIAMWLEGLGLDEVTSWWLTAGPSVNDLGRFGARLGRVVQDSVGGGSADTRSDGGGAPARPFFDVDAAVVAMPPGRRVVLVIDNAQHVDDERVVEELVGVVERHHSFHLVLCCPGRHPLESAVPLGLEVNTVEPRDLLLDVEEIVALGDTLGTAIDPLAAARLRRSVGGWIWAIRMALDGGPDPGPTVREFLRTRVLPGADEGHLLDHLLRFSLASSLTPALIRDLGDQDAPGRLLRDLEAAGLVERSIGGDEVHFVIAEPARTVLRQQLESADPDAARRFHRRLARWFVTRGGARDIPVAFRHAVAGGDWALAGQLWSEWLAVLIGAGPSVLGPSLRLVPPHIVARFPTMGLVGEVWATTARAAAGPDGRRASTRALAAACRRVPVEQWGTMSMGELLVVAGGAVADLRLTGRLEEAVAAGGRAEVMADNAAGADRWQAGPDRAAWFHLQQGLTSTMVQDDAGAVRHYTRAWELASTPGGRCIRAGAAANLALVHALDGDPAGALGWAARQRAVGGGGRWCDGDGDGDAGARVALGLVALDRLDEAGVAAELDLLDADADADALELWPFVAFLHAQRGLVVGPALSALSSLDRVRMAHAHERGGPASAALMARARADLLIACGRGDKAAVVVRTQGTDHPLMRLPASRIEVLTGRFRSGAEADLMTWDPATPPRDRVELLLLAGVSALRTGHWGEARTQTDRALDLYRRSGMLRPFAAIPTSDLAELLSSADGGLAPDDTARVTGQVPLYPESLRIVELSRREQSVLEALDRTGSRQTIADTLYVSVNTVKTHLANIYTKFGSSSRREVLSAAREHGLLPPREPRVVGAASVGRPDLHRRNGC